MSSILPFVVVAFTLAIVASVAIGEDPQPATTEDGVRRDGWRERLRPVLQWLERSARDIRAWVAGAAADLATRIRRRREQRAEARAAAPAATPDVRPGHGDDHVEPVAVAPAARPQPTTDALTTPEGVLATALLVKPDVALGDVAGEPVARVGPSALTRARSAFGLAVMIVLLGLGLAAVLGTLVALGGAALDGFVN